MRCSQKTINSFILAREEWIKLHVERVKARPQFEKTAEEVDKLRRDAMIYIPQRVEYYSAIMSLKPAEIKITSARKRFGSCSGDNRLCFSLYLMAYPAAAIDYVVVHELAHIKEKNHSKNFYSIINKILPDYKERIKLLR